MKINRYIIAIIAVFMWVLTACTGGPATPPARHSAYTASYLAESLPTPNGIESIVTVIEYADKNNRDDFSYSYNFDIQGRAVSEGTSDYYRTYGYDALGHISATSAPDVFEAEYDDAGDLVHVSVGPIDSGFVADTYYTYDAQGRVIEEKYVNDDFETLVRYDYGEDGLIDLEQTYGPGFYHKVEYNEKGIPIHRTETDSVSGKTIYIDYTYKFDSAGNWIKQTAKVKKNSWSKGKNYSVTTREINYYDSPYIVHAAAEGSGDGKIDEAAAVPAMASTGGRPGIGKYIDDVTFRLKMAPYTLGGASGTMFIILLVLTVIGTGIAIWWGAEIWGCYNNLAGEPDEKGMRRMWMYNGRPYQAVLYTMGCILFGLLASILLLFVVGGVFFLLMWIIKGLLWALYYVGWICVILGGLALFGKEPVGCLPLIIGIAIVSAGDWIERTGETVVAWGESFMDAANFFGFGIGLFSEFWDVMLIIILAPMAIFLAFALVVIIFNLLLAGGEWLFTKIYNINRPCPQCGKHADYEYLIDGQPHPVALRPGIYGSFHHTHYDAFDVPEYRVPTMLLNGRDRLDRRCRSCGAIVNTGGAHSVGTDVHIGLVGHVGVGKTYLIFSGLNELMQEYAGDIEQVDNVDRNFDVNLKSQQISARRDIQTDRRTSYRAVQLMLKRSNHLVPYHLHFYDVAGEQFTTNTALSDDAMRFYTNVQSIVVVIDPLMIDTQAPGVRASLEFERWQKEKNPSPMRYNPTDTLASLNVYLEKYGRSPRKIDLTFVCVKSDMGYFGAMNYPADPTPEQIREFMKNVLGMTTLVNTGDSFRSVSFYATSVYEPNKTSLRELFRHLLRQRKISV